MISLSRAEMKAALDKDGYVVVPNVLDSHTCDCLYDSFWDYLEALSPEIDRSNRATWTKRNLPINTKGLIQHFNIGFQRFTVDAHMLIKPVFQELYATERLRSSFDGVSFTQRGTRLSFQNLAHWDDVCWENNPVHIDQTTSGFLSIQGGLAVTTQKEDEHTFVCVPGSHIYHDELLEIWNTCAKEEFELKSAEYQLDKTGKKPLLRRPQLHWMVMNPRQLAFLRGKQLNMRRGLKERGDVVLWDSRTVHASAGYCATASPAAFRLQIFVCMCPIPPETAEERIREQNKRKKLTSWALYRNTRPIIFVYSGKSRGCTQQSMG